MKMTSTNDITHIHDSWSMGTLEFFFSLEVAAMTGSNLFRGALVKDSQANYIIQDYTKTSKQLLVDGGFDGVPDGRVILDSFAPIPPLAAPEVDLFDAGDFDIADAAFDIAGG